MGFDGSVGGGLRAGLFGSGSPVGRVDVGEDAIAALYFGEAGVLFGSDGVCGLEGLPDGFDLVELIIVGEEANFCVVAGGTGGDEKLPVGRFEEEEFAAELLEYSLAKGSVSLEAGGASFAGVDLCGVDVGVSPGGFWVQPDLIVALGPP